MTDTPKTPDGEGTIDTIIELVDIEHVNPVYLLIAALIGAAVIAGVVLYLGRGKEDAS